MVQEPISWDGQVRHFMTATIRVVQYHSYFSSQGISCDWKTWWYLIFYGSRERKKINILIILVKFCYVGISSDAISNVRQLIGLQGCHTVDLLMIVINV